MNSTHGRKWLLSLGSMSALMFLLVVAVSPALAGPGDDDVTFRLRVTWENIFGQEYTLYDQTQNLNAGYYFSSGPYNLDRGVTINVRIELTRGSGINFFTLDSDNYAAFRDFMSDPDSGETFSYYTAGSGLDIQAKTFSFTSPWDGDYYFVVDNTGTWSADEDSLDQAFWALICGVGIVVIVVIVLIIVLVVRGGKKAPQRQPPAAHPPPYGAQQAQHAPPPSQPPVGTGRCSGCGSPVKPTDKYCLGCGIYLGTDRR